MRIKEHLETNSKSHIFKHLNTNRNCNELYDTECFVMIDSATSSYRLKLKSQAHHLGKTIAKQIGKANKYFYNYLVTYSYLLSYFFHLFYCYYFCNHVTLILFKIISLIVNVICNHSDCINISDFYCKLLSRFLLHRVVGNDFRKVSIL